MSKKKSQRHDAEPDQATPEAATPDVPAETPAEPAGPDPREPGATDALGEMTQKWQRLAADYQNYQRRAQRQIEQAGQFAHESIAKGLLPVLDNFQHTLERGREATDVATVMQGVQIVYDHLFNVLEGFGMKRIAVEPGTAFDPNHHEAMLHEESDAAPPGTVVRELAPGYVMNERTLRPAKVSVAKTPSVAADEVDDQPGGGA